MAVKPVGKLIDPDYRRISGQEVFGVAAFSRHGISSVAFTLSDGVNPNVTDTITDESWNEENVDWVWCYNATLDASSLNDGTVTLTVDITDGNSNTRQLTQDLRNNSGNTLRFHEAWVDVNSGDDGTGAVDDINSPFATIMAAADSFGLANGDDHDPGGCVIYLEEGDHNYGNYSFGQNIESQSPDWLRITKSASATRANTRIVSTNSEGIRGYYIWFDNLTIACNQTTFNIGPRNTTSGTRYLRTSNLVVEDIDYSGQVEAVTAFTGGWDNQWHQNNTVNNLRNGWGAQLVRGIHYTRLGEDVLPSCPCAINVVCDEVDYGTYAGTWHPDGIQLFSVNENLLYYNIRMLEVTGQLVFQGDSLTAANNVALVNVFAKESTGSGFVSQFLSGYEHLMMYHCHFDQTMRFDETELTLTDLDIRNCYFDSMNAQGGSQATVEASGTIDHCMFGDGTLWGTNGIDGSSKAYNNSGAGDFSWASSSPGYQEGSSTVPYTVPTGDRGPGSNPDANAYPDATVPVGFEASSLGTSYTGITDGLIFDAGNSRSVTLTLSTSYSVGSPVSVQYQLVNGGTPGPWIEAPDTTIAGGSLTCSVPVRTSPNFYTVNLRTIDNAGAVLETITGADNFGVGKLVALIGQSNGSLAGSTGTKTRNYATSTITWNGSALSYDRTTTGQGAITLAESLAAHFGCAVGIYNGAVYASSLLEANSYQEDVVSTNYGSLPFWLPIYSESKLGTPRTSSWVNFLNGLQALSGDVSYIVCVNGESDALQHTPIHGGNTYGAAETVLRFKLGLSQLKRSFVAAGILAPMYVASIGYLRLDDTSVTEWEETHSRIRAALAEPGLNYLDIFPSSSHYDLLHASGNTDISHLDGPGYETFYQRIADTITGGHRNGVGPRIVGARVADESRYFIIVTCGHTTGTSLKFGGGSPRGKLFKVRVDGVDKAIENVYVSESNIYIEMSLALGTGLVELAYLRGTGYDGTETGDATAAWATTGGAGAIYDDQDYPLQPKCEYFRVKENFDE